MKKFGKFVLVIINISLMALPFMPEYWVISPVFQSIPFTIYISLSILSITSILIFLEWKVFVLILGIQLSGFTYILHPYLNSFSLSDSHENQEVLSITTWNTLYWDQGEDASDFEKQLSALPADVLLLQEYIHWDREAKNIIQLDNNPNLKDCCNYKNVWSKGELVTASNLDGIQIDVDNPFILAVEFQIHSQKLIILNVHVPVHLDVQNSIFHSNFWNFIRERIGSRKKTFSSIKSILLREPIVIIGGDFNSTMLMSSMRDSVFSLTDFNILSMFEGSYPANGSLPNWWRLDHLLSKNVKKSHCVVKPQTLFNSDHMPINCVFSLM